MSTARPGAAAPENRPDTAGAQPSGTSSVRKTPNRRFDAEKVARLKDEIASGRYEIDPLSVADRFIEHERNGP